MKGKVNMKRQVSFEVLDTKISSIQDDVKEIKEKLERDYVTRQEFEPIKKVVYGMVAIVLTSVVGALVALILRK